MLRDREELKKSLLSLTSGEVEFRSYTGHTKSKGGGWTAEPVPNRNGSWYKGVDKLTRELQESGEPYVNPTDERNPLARYTIFHGSRMDMSEPENQLILKWLVEHERLALSYEEGKGDPMKMYYIHDELVETTSIAKRFEFKKKALDLVTNASDSVLGKFVRALGYPIHQKTPQQLRNMLYDVADKTPEKIIEVMNDKRIELKDLATRLIDAGIVKTAKTGELKYKDIVLAPSYEGYLTWLAEAERDKKGERFDLLITMKSDLDNK